MSLFGGLYVGTSGLQTSQNALNTVAHNMVNAETEGYTRQQVAQTTRTYNTISKTGSANSYQQIGLGVSYAEVRQVRDFFLDKSYRKESARQGFYDVSCDAIEEVEEVFQELDGEAFANTLNNLWVAVEELDKDPSNTVNQSVFIQRCDEFMVRADAVFKNLCDYQDDLNYGVKQKVDRMNEIGQRIVKLNEDILKIESNEQEHANDLRDERNALIDELSEFAPISVKTDADGNEIIQVEGVDFVTVGEAKTIDVYIDPITGFYTPVWKQLARYDSEGNVMEDSVKGARVCDLNREIATELNTDMGSLKSTLYARGDRRANYEDLDPAVYKDIKDSVVMNVMAEFDQLVHDVAEGVNKVFKDARDAAVAISGPTTTYMLDPSTGEAYKIFEMTDPAGGYTTNNMHINESLKQAPSLLGFIRDDGIVDQYCADALKKVFTEETHLLNPEVKTTTNIVNYYNNLISQVSNTGYIMRGISANQEITVTNIREAREEVVGVSTDEELSNMIMFQNAFNASSRYINVMSEMIEHLISTLGS